MFRRLTLILLALALAGCGGGTATTTTGGTTTASAPASAAATSAAEPSVAASLDSATTPAPAESAQATPAETSAAAPSESAAAAASALRTFQIVPEQTEASYSVQEQFLSQDLPVQAVGKTNAVEGQFQFSQDGQPTGEVTSIKVDLRTLTSDSQRRDNAIKTRWLESETYPFAEFVSTEAQNLPASYNEGDEVSFKLVGDITIRDVTKPVTFDVTGALQGDTVTGTATTLIYMKDFGFEAPNIAGVLTVQDGVTLTVNFTAKEATSAQ